MKTIITYAPVVIARIVNNVLASCWDITLLSKESFLFLKSFHGFLYYDNLEDFVYDFSNGRNLRDNILAYTNVNTAPWINATSLKQRSDMYRQIVDCLNTISDQYPSEVQHTKLSKQ